MKKNIQACVRKNNHAVIIVSISIPSGWFGSTNSSCQSTSLRHPEGPLQALLPDFNLLLAELKLLHLLMRLQLMLHLHHLLRTHQITLCLSVIQLLQPAPTRMSLWAYYRLSWPNDRVRPSQHLVPLSMEICKAFHQPYGVLQRPE